MVLSILSAWNKCRADLLPSSHAAVTEASMGSETLGVWGQPELCHILY